METRRKEQLSLLLVTERTGLATTSELVIHFSEARVKETLNFGQEKKKYLPSPMGCVLFEDGAGAATFTLWLFYPETVPNRGGCPEIF